MCCSAPGFFIVIYMTLIYLFGLYLRFIAFQDYFECFACREMNKQREYDYIVVGSGSAGSVIARRLAEDKNVKILLIEAGSGGNSVLQIPAVGLMLQNSIFDWQYRTVPQKKACLGLEKKVSKWPMGRILGGTGMLNNMIYSRGHPDDFARWFKESCNFNYTADILPYFQKLEKNAFNKHQWTVPINDLPYKSNLSDYFLQAGLCLGFGLSDSLDAEPGFSVPKLTIQKGQRWTPYHQLAKLKKRNLVIVTNSQVEKVLLRGNAEAYGVKYTHLDEAVYVTASKGIILSAGVIGTPKILMLSGIGPKKHLEQMKITPKVDLPVGDNLQDHVTTGIDLLTLDFPPDVGIPYMVSPMSVFKYFVMSRGPWTSPGCENLAFFNTDKQIMPELQFMIMPLGITSDQGSYLRTLIGVDNKVYKEYFAKIDRPAITVLPVVLHPKSRGTVRLKSKNPKTPPLIDPNYLSDSYDVHTLIEGIEMIKEMIDTPPMKRLGAKLHPQKFPGCEKFEFDTKPYWECYVRHLTLTSYHPVGTCSLGSVVDYEFKVRGTENLYVVDGSILPDLPSGNPNGAIMMLAERAAATIQNNCWLSQTRCCASDSGVQCDC